MKTRPKPPAQVRREMEKIRKIALALPETREDHPWGESAFKVKGKVFVFMGNDADSWGISVKLDESRADALAKPFCAPTGYGLGKHGWVSVRFENTQAAPLGLVRRWIEESFCTVAPLSVLKKMEEP